MTNNRDDLEIEPPKVSDVEKIAELDSDIELHDNILDTITEIVKKRVSELEETEPSDYEQMSASEHQERLKSTFSHDGSGSSNDEDLSESDKSVSEIQSELSRRIFDN